MLDCATAAVGWVVAVSCFAVGGGGSDGGGEGNVVGGTWEAIGDNKCWDGLQENKRPPRRQQITILRINRPSRKNSKRRRRRLIQENFINEIIRSPIKNGLEQVTHAAAEFRDVRSHSRRLRRHGYWHTLSPPA